MHIIDIDGKRIEITDINAAIKQATMFSTMQHEDASFKSVDDTLKIYWADILNKLKMIPQQ